MPDRSDPGRRTIATADPQAVTALVDVLAADGIAIVPTDTVYGLAARADSTATSRLFECKGRSADVPVAVLCSTADQALALADEASVTPAVRAAAAVHWPGPLTVVLPRRPGLGWQLGEPTSTIGLRCPDHALIRAVAARVGPLATTSANRHGQPTPTSAADACRSLLCAVDLVVDGGELAGLPSTVVDATGSGFRILRQGVAVLEDDAGAGSPST